MYLVHYDCVTAAGLGVNHLLTGLYEGVDHSSIIQGTEFAKPVLPGGRVCFIPQEITGQKIFNRNFQQALQTSIQKCWEHFFETLSIEARKNISEKKTILLFSSTKGMVEDYIWSLKEAGSARAHTDPFSPLVTWFDSYLKERSLKMDFEVVSNACASSHVAIEVAQMCLQSGTYENAIVLSLDLVGPFVYQGFNSLKVLTHTTNRPFDENRDGLQLGEAVAVMFFSNTQTGSGDLKISSVESETEGGSVTRPSMDGRCLFRLMKKVLEKSKKNPDLFLAHGTGTKFNDLSETLAIESLAKEFQTSSLKTGIKWSVGHTLGASGLLDVIAASEIIKRKKVFKIHNSKLIDETVNVIPKNVMVTSLGFGGVHSALLLESFGV